MVLAVGVVAAGVLLVPFILRDESPVEVIMGRNAAWPPKMVGYDYALPGYHIVGDIASVTLKPTGKRMPERLVLAIATSPGMPPGISSFLVTTTNLVIQSTLPNGPYYEVLKDTGGKVIGTTPKETYFTSEVVGNEVRVTFQPNAMELLKGTVEVSWIDYYRH